MRKQFCFLLIVCLMLFFLTACNQSMISTKEATYQFLSKSAYIKTDKKDLPRDKNKTQKSKTEITKILKLKNSRNSTNDKASKSELSDSFIKTVLPYFNTSKRTIHYNGYAEYGHTIKFSSKKMKDRTITITYTGEMSDEYGEDERGKRTFTANYYIAGDTIIEVIKNKDYMSKKKNVLNSPIPNFLVLKGAIKKKNHWEQEVRVKGKKYIAKTKIVKVEKNTFSTKTIIHNFKGCYKNTYIENREYKIGEGLIHFDNSPYYEDEEPTYEYLFGYSYSTATND